jgi:hypothetical protein
MCNNGVMNDEGTTAFDEVVCGSCGYSFGEYPTGMGSTRAPCPRCSSGARTVRKAPFHATITPRASLGYEAFPEGTKSKSHRFAWGFTGWDFSVVLGRLVRKASHFDRRGNRRYEHVEDPETGDVLIHQDHPLTEHTGHGSAKFKSS